MSNVGLRLLKRKKGEREGETKRVEGRGREGQKDERGGDEEGARGGVVGRSEGGEEGRSEKTMRRVSDFRKL